MFSVVVRAAELLETLTEDWEEEHKKCSDLNYPPTSNSGQTDQTNVLTAHSTNDAELEH